eukprot:scaffold131299_cov72-Phaeocystis_antarctica.AAC.1
MSYSLIMRLIVQQVRERSDHTLLNSLRAWPRLSASRDARASRRRREEQTAATTPASALAHQAVPARHPLRSLRSARQPVGHEAQLAVQGERRGVGVDRLELPVLDGSGVRSSVAHPSPRGVQHTLQLYYSCAVACEPCAWVMGDSYPSSPLVDIFLQLELSGPQAGRRAASTRTGRSGPSRAPVLRSTICGLRRSCCLARPVTLNRNGTSVSVCAPVLTVRRPSVQVCVCASVCVSSDDGRQAGWWGAQTRGRRCL